MNLNKELEMPLEHSWNIVTIILELVVIMLLMYLFYDYFWKIIKNYIIKPNVPKLKDRYLRKLENLINEVNDKAIDLRDAYYSLSKIIREFIEKSTGINVLNLTKSEIQKFGIKKLSLLMEEYYPPEFSKFSSGDIVDSIKRTMELIKGWE